MGRYRDALKKVENTETGSLTNLKNPLEPSSLGFLGTPPAHFENSQAANDDSDQAENGAHFAWLIHFTDRNPLTVTFSPVENHAGALACYPDAVAAEPIGATARQSETEIEEPPFIAADDPDDRHTCTQCANLRRDVCTIAKPGGTVSAVIGYLPGAMFKAQLHRCEGFHERGE